MKPWKNSINILYSPAIGLEVYVKFFRSLTRPHILPNIRGLHLVILTEQGSEKVTEYINIEWLVVVSEHDLFVFLREMLRRKETYMGGDEARIIRISLHKLDATIQENILREFDTLILISNTI